MGFEQGGRVYVIEGYHGDIFVGGNFIYPDIGKTVFSPNLAQLKPDSIAVGVTQPASETERISIYPNPVCDELRIANCKLQIGDELFVTDVLGRVIVKQTVSVTTRYIKLQTQNLPLGIYLLRVKTKEGNSVTKFVKQ